MPFAIGLLILTLARYYGYYFIDGVPARVSFAFGGIHQMALAVAVFCLIFHRISNWQVAVVLMAALFITVVESSLIAVCGSWYAFKYVGPPLVGDSCELMLGRPFTKPMAYTLATLSAIILPRIWGKAWGTLK